MNMRVDDIEGAKAKKFFLQKNSRKMGGFFPSVVSSRNHVYHNKIDNVRNLLGDSPLSNKDYQYNS